MALWTSLFTPLYAWVHAAAGADDPLKAPVLIAAQRERLQERDRLEERVQKLVVERKYVERIEVAEAKLAIEREVFGPASEEALGSLDRLARWQEFLGNWAAAVKARREILGRRVETLDRGHWRVTDARLALQDVEARARMTTDQRRQLDEADRLQRTSTELKGKKSFKEATELARQIVVIRKEVLSEHHSNYATAINNLAILLQAQGDLTAARPLFEQAIAIHREVQGERHPYYATCVNNLAGLLRAQGDFAGARSLFEQALTIRKEALGEGHPDSVSSSKSLVSLVQKQGDLPARLKERDRIEEYIQKLEARGLLTEMISPSEAVLAIEREVFGLSSPDVIRSLKRLSLLHEFSEDWAAAARVRREILDRFVETRGLKDWHTTDARLAMEDVLARSRMTVAQRQRLDEVGRLQQSVLELSRKGSYRDAISLARRIVTIREEVQGDRHPDYAASLNNLGLMLKHNGEFHVAQPLYERAMALRKEVLGERHPDYAMSLNNLAGLMQARGDLAAARPLLERALALDKEVLGENHLGYASSLNNLALVLLEQGDLAAARPLLERAVAIDQVLHGDRHPDYVKSLSNLAGLMRAQGDLASARPLFERALAIRGEVLGERHPDYATSLGNLALLLQEQGDLASARPLYERALALNREGLGERHPAYATSLNNLALLLKEQGDLASARPLYERALAISKEVLGERHPDYATSLNNLAGLLTKQGDPASARPLLEQALAIQKETMGDRHPLYAMYLNNLGYLLVVKGDLARATRVVNQALDINERLVLEMLPVLTEREQIAYLVKARKQLSNILELTAGRPEQDRDSYRRVLAWKGLVAQGAAARTMPRTPQARALREVLVPQRAELNSLYQARIPAEQAVEHARRIRDLAGRIAAREAEVARVVGWKPETPDPARIHELLPEDVALVDLLEYTHVSPGIAGELESRYVAFVVRRGQPPIRVELGSVARIAEPLASWRARLQIGGDSEDHGREVARLVWVPLTRHLKGIRTVLVSPDGALCFLPWGALPGEEPGSVLIRRYSFGVITSARQLSRLASSDGATSATGGMLALGGVDYGASVGQPTAGPIDGAILASRSIPNSGEPLNFAPLPGTKAEAESVAGLNREIRIGAVETLGGAEATKDRLRARMVNKRYLHLATHGYFAPPEVKSALAPEEDRTSLRSWEEMGRAEVSGYFPGLLSGLVWAGANRPPTDPITGALDVGAALMTAEEVSGLDLKGCDLAVLSACETGLGRTAGGEGVLGLQGAFHQAGCRTVVASLWKVDDAATSALMTRFYSNLWEKKLPPLEAMRQAQLSILDDPNFGDGGNPQLWAAWTLSGDPGGLRKLDPPPIPRPEVKK